MFTKTITAGRFTKDPERRAYGSDGVIAAFSLATDYGRDKTAFYDCIAFGKTAELILEHFNKGRAILVEGVFQNNNYEKDVAGQKVTMYGMQLVVNQISFIDSKSDKPATAQQAPAQQQQQQQQGGFQQQQAPQQQQQQGFGGFGGFGTANDDGVPF